jgi:DAK2 domain fusion protein YloV
VKNANESIENQLKQYLSKIGDSIVAVLDEDIIKIHVHTNNPGTVLEKALTIGALENIKIENMRIQHTNKISFEQPGDHAKAKDIVVYAQAIEEPAAETEPKEIGFIVVSAGAGFKETFESLGADIVVEGGQTMNPSTEDFIEAIERLNAESILILPNNKNIILAAEQAAALIENKKVIVVPTMSVPQGVSALINYSEMSSAEENLETMREVIAEVRTGQITYAVRDTVIEDKEIKKGDILGMVDGKIEHVAQDVDVGAKGLLDLMLAEGGEVLSIFYGEAVTEESAAALLDYVAEKYPGVEAEVQFGGQPMYDYVFSVE